MDLEQLLRQRFQKIRKTRGRNGIEIRVNCPLCAGGDRKFHMYINVEREVYNCYKCHQDGSVRQLLGEMYKKNDDMPPPMQVRDEPLPDNVESPGYMVPVNTLDSTHPAVQYLQNRKRAFDLNEMYNCYGVKYCVEGKTFSNPDFTFHTTNTLVFPVWMFGKLVGWQSRLLYDPKALDDNQCEALGFPKDEDGDWLLPPKYLTSPGFRKGRVLYNFDVARSYPYVVVTEGVFDAMSAGPSAIATFGTGISDQQCRLLKNYWSTVVLLLDPDVSNKQVEDIYNELHRAVTVIQVKLKDYKDPGDAPRDAIWSQISDTMKHMRLTEKQLVLDGLNSRQPKPEATGIWQIIH